MLSAMKAAAALSALGGMLAISVLGARAQIIPGVTGPSGATSVPGGRAPAPPTTSTTLPGRPPTLGGAPAGSQAPSGNVGKTIRLGNPRPAPNQPDQDPGDPDPADLPPDGNDEPGAAPSHDGLGQAPEAGGQEHGVDQAPRGALDNPGDAGDADAMDEYEEDWEGGDDGTE
jgi:hypothetical protein